MSGPSWQPLRAKFLDLSQTLLNVSPDTFAELTTIYVKYLFRQNETPVVYAVAWLKKSAEIVVGLALPEYVTAAVLQPPPPDKKYPRLTKYLTITLADDVPEQLGDWARAAYANVVAIKS